jgi:hypothetical protein
MHDNYYPDWQNNRLNYIINHYGKDYFENKRILELAPCNGYIGHVLHELGATVYQAEGRQGNVDYIKKTYPHLFVQQKDLDTDVWDLGKYDIIINFGLMYHIHNHHKALLENCIKNCTDLILESVIFDSFDDEVHFRNEEGFDQSLSGIGGTPSTSYVENILENCKTTYQKHCSELLRGGNHHYNWPDTNSKILNPWARRLWTIKTNN